MAAIGANDGKWAEKVIAWINLQPPGFFLWSDWSNNSPADDLLNATTNPAEVEAWQAAWSGTSYAGSWWPGPPPPSAR